MNKPSDNMSWFALAFGGILMMGKTLPGIIKQVTCLYKESTTVFSNNETILES